jgi:hypothetical protein
MSGKSYICRRLLWQEVSADFATEKATLRVKQLFWRTNAHNFSTVILFQ